jgi:hypothetical protein
MAEIILTIGEQIERSRDGRTQKWIVSKMNDLLPEDEQVTEVDFSNKKNGHLSFTDKQLKALSKILKTTFTFE